MIRLVLIALVFIPFFVTAQLQVAKIFSDNMVLQRNQPIKVWGKAIPGKIVVVTFANEKAITDVKSDSTWITEFKKKQACATPQTLTVQCGDEKIVFRNILTGDLWVCIGQSNMEWPMVKEIHYREELPTSLQPMIRFYNPTYAGKNTFNIPFTDSITQHLTVEKFYEGKWQTCDSNSFKAMSAVAYFFGKYIVTSINVPIGLLNLSIGGAPLETFISIDVFKSNKQFSDKVNGDWLTNNALPVWIRERGKQNVGSLLNVPMDLYGKNHPFKPGFAWQSGVEPLLNMPIKGLLCYQGESNAQEIERVYEYAELSAVMIADYRSKWKQPDLPFYYVQLSSIDTLRYKGYLWPEFRDEQRKMIQLIPNSGMAVCSDIGFKNDVHPTNKKSVGERLAKWALNKIYQMHFVPSGPLPLTAIYKDRKIIISFQYGSKGLTTSDGNALKGFSIDGINEIGAVIKNYQVIISANEKPQYVYYGWKPFTDANLVNSDQLPASTFRISVN